MSKQIRQQLGVELWDKLNHGLWDEIGYGLLIYRLKDKLLYELRYGLGDKLWVKLRVELENALAERWHE